MTFTKPDLSIAKVPIMPLREVVMFPRCFMPLFVGRKPSIRTINRSINHHDRLLVMVAQRDSSTVDLATRKEIFHIGTVSRILQLLQMPDSDLKVLFEGLYRVRLVPEGASPKRYDVLKPTSLASLYPFEEVAAATPELESLVNSVRKAWDIYAGKVKYRQDIVQGTIGPALAVSGTAPGVLADAVAQFLKIHYLEKQKILETANGVERLELVNTLLRREIKQ